MRKIWENMEPIKILQFKKSDMEKWMLPSKSALLQDTEHFRKLLLMLPSRSRKRYFENREKCPQRGNSLGA
jgi:hypothetical protein